MRNFIKKISYLILICWELGFIVNVPKYNDFLSILAALILMFLPIIFIFKKRNKKSTTSPSTNIAYYAKKVQVSATSSIEPNYTKRNDINVKLNNYDVHNDLKNIIWIGNGPYQNYWPENSSLNNDIQINLSHHIEPSALYLDLDISEPSDKLNVPLPGYYPDYKSLSPEQRWLYWNFLKYPYSSSNNIGYVFLFYYGLERYLWEKNSNEAFDMVLELLKLYPNTSFQSYATTAIIFCIVNKKNKEWANNFINLIENDINLSTFPNLILLLKYQLDIPVYPRDIIQNHKKFNFNNTRYIKLYPEMFVDYLSSTIFEKYNLCYINMKQFFTDNSIIDLKKEILPAFANFSLSPREFKVSDFFSDTNFNSSINELLIITHDKIKQDLSAQRKNNKL